MYLHVIQLYTQISVTMRVYLALWEAISFCVSPRSSLMPTLEKSNFLSLVFIQTRAALLFPTQYYYNFYLNM